MLVGSCIPNFLLSISFRWVNLSMYTELCLEMLSAVWVVVGGGGVESEFSDLLWLWPSLGQAEKKLQVFILLFHFPVLGSVLCLFVFTKHSITIVCI